MHIAVDGTENLFRWIRDEVEFDKIVENGNRGMAVRRVQEWLNFHKIGLVVDGSFGPVTERSIKRFQSTKKLPETGKVDEATFSALVRPMMDVLKPKRVRKSNMGQAIAAYGKAHLAIHPIEIGGQNRGPWVRLYMRGFEGNAFPWCAGFVTFLMNQAAQTLEVDLPIEGSFSCDSLAAQAKATNRFLRETDASPSEIAPGSIFLVRRTSTDWTHTGIVTDATTQTFDTIEGNTNDEGVREGFEVCARTRGYDSKDFVLVSSIEN